MNTQETKEVAPPDNHGGFLYDVMQSGAQITAGIKF